MSGKALLFTHTNFLFCSPLTGCITREEVFQLNWISVWSQLKPVGKASCRLRGVGWCLLFLCQENGNGLFPFEQPVSASHLQSSSLPVLQEQQRYSWVGGIDSSPSSSHRKTKCCSSFSPCLFHFLLQTQAHPWAPPQPGGCGCINGCWAPIGDWLKTGVLYCRRGRADSEKELEFCSMKKYIISAWWLFFFVLCLTNCLGKRMHWKQTRYFRSL